MLRPDFLDALVNDMVAGKIQPEVLALICLVAAGSEGRYLSSRVVRAALRTGDLQARRAIKDAVKSGWIGEDPEKEGLFKLDPTWIQHCPQMRAPEPAPVADPSDPPSKEGTPPEPEPEDCPQMRAPESGSQSGPPSNEGTPDSTPDGFEVTEVSDCPQKRAPLTETGSQSGSKPPSKEGTPRRPKFAIRKRAEKTYWKEKAQEGEILQESGTPAQEGQPGDESPFSPEFEAKLKNGRP